MYTLSISGSSLLSSYDENNAHETNGKSKREFEQIDSVLYDEEAPKRSSIKKICEEWTNKPHFRIRGRSYSIDYQDDIDILKKRSNRLSLIDQISTEFSTIDLNLENRNLLPDDSVSGRSSIDSIEGSVISDSGDLDNDNEFDNSDTASTILGDHSSASDDNSSDTDENYDKNRDYSLTRSKRNRTKHPQRLIKCLKDSIIDSLATSLLQKFLLDEQTFLQHYIKHVCSNNSIRFHAEARPYSLPPRSSSQGRMSQIATTLTHTSLQQNPPTTTIPSAFRSTTDTNIELESLLHVKRIGGAKVGPNQTVTASPSSPRKPQSSVPSTAVRTERAATSLSIEKRNQQKISLIGTAISNIPPHVTLTAPQSSQAHTRQLISTPVTRRYGSATTSSSTAHILDTATRFPPIPSDPPNHNDLGMPTRSHVLTTTIIESIPVATRIVSSKSSGSNLSFANKVRTFSNLGKITKASRSVIITPNKEFSNSPSISPVRSITANVSSTILKATSATRSHQQTQKKSFVTTKSSPPPSSSTTAIKVPATHIY